MNKQKIKQQLLFLSASGKYKLWHVKLMRFLAKIIVKTNRSILSIEYNNKNIEELRLAEDCLGITEKMIIKKQK